MRTPHHHPHLQLLVLLLSLALISAHLHLPVTASSSPLTLQYIDDDPDALCNDGTPAAYYIRRTGSTRWHIHLMGGFWCWDNTSCEQRHKQTPQLMSSRDLLPNMSLSGIFSTDSQTNPVFHDAQHVYVHYCSSDAWSGNATERRHDSTSSSSSSLSLSPDNGNESINTGGGWYFRGRRIVDAVVRRLLEREGMKDAQHVMLSGCSAGGMGALLNADHVGQMIRQYVKRANNGSDVDFRVLVDSGVFLDLVLPGQEQEVIDQRTQLSHGQQLWQGVVNGDCARSFQHKHHHHRHTSKEDLWRCYLGPDSLRHVRSSILVMQFLSDLWQVWWNVGGSGDTGNLMDRYNAEESVRRYVDHVGSETMAVLETTNGDGSDNDGEIVAPSLAFVPSCMWHCAIFDSGFTDVRLTQSGQSLADIMLAWFSSTGTSGVRSGKRTAQERRLNVIADRCSGFNCSYGCPEM